MTVYVFTGPSLPPEDARRELPDAVCLPPVSQGDVYRVALLRPRAIGIIDGYFERQPAVWHKEILWAMSQGVHVYGSASMGALRAAELAAFGMVGVGAIFEAYRDGTLEDDDEVAVLHGSAERGYPATSEALVNIRRTLADAEDAGVIAPRAAQALVDVAKQLFYGERSYELILRHAEKRGVPPGDLAAFREWLPRGQVNQKREDALAMLRAMRDDLEAHPEPKSVAYPFEYTDMWDHAWRFAGELHGQRGMSPAMLFLDALLDELRLQGESFKVAEQGAMARFLALDEAARQGKVVTRQVFEATADTFRRERGLLEPQALEQWLARHHLTRDAFAQLMEEEAQVRWVETVVRKEAMTRLPDLLRVTGDYARLAARAQDKQRVLETAWLQNPSLESVGLTYDELLRWYFTERLGRPVPADVASYAAAIGFPEEGAFRIALVREFCYCSESGRGQPRARTLR